MPTPPTRFTSKLLSIRALTPRSHKIILPAALVASSVPAKQRFASSGAALLSLALSAVMNGVSMFSGLVVDAPTYDTPVPSSTAWNARRNVAAATVVTHGAGWSNVLAPGPLLPAEFATKIFVANSAGNSGPGASTLDHPAPWVTTVAAATFRRAFQAVELGTGVSYVGASTTKPLNMLTPFITAESAKLSSAAPLDAKRCFAGTLDATKAAGKMILCERGVNARIDKSFEVKRVGGVGMVLVNVPDGGSLNGDYHAVPSVHVQGTASA